MGEINKLLNSDDALFITQVFGVKAGGNFEGKSIFFLAESLQEVSKKQSQSFGALVARLDPLLAKLRKYRSQRIPPLTDNKVIVSWNGMLITALVEAGNILNEPRYINAAKKAAMSLWKMQQTKQGKLWRINLDRKPSIMAKQDDYVHFSEALIALYDVTHEALFLQQAEQLANEMIDQFFDPSFGALVMGKDQLLFAQPKDAYDGALPSGNAVAVRVFNRLFKRTGKEKYREYSSKILHAFSSGIINQPSSYSYMLAQLDELKKGEVGSHQYAARGGY